MEEQQLREAVSRAERGMVAYGRLARSSPGAAPPASLRRDVQEALRLCAAVPESERGRPRTQALIAAAEDIHAELQAVEASLASGRAGLLSSDGFPVDEAGGAEVLELQRAAARQKRDVDAADRHLNECLEIGPAVIGELTAQGQALRDIYTKVLHVAGQVQIGGKTVGDIISNERFLSWLLAGAAGAALLLWLLFRFL